jgi:hypothetical protein
VCVFFRIIQLSQSISKNIGTTLSICNKNKRLKLT